MDEEVTPKRFKLRSSDGVYCYIDVETAKGSKVLAEAAKFFGSESSVIKVPIKAEILQKIIAWLENHQDGNASINCEGLLSSWENDYFLVNDEELIGIQVASNYFSIDALFNIASKKIAERIFTVIIDKIESENMIVDESYDS